ncbi:MAG: hypothetical protein HPY89_01300 [Pelotomaculum sp.]|uniref:Hypothetical membrane protein n=1 Tax=Pelotomaculum thermopropionicum (strain DSM 13744 / JCM 10971 / SI) TaxID=370438 RepID=A5D348_PELTS|nr:hypothetical protein [Pelotomaculum sp.]BAF59321.1 hypothetical membrane protein [Pelotomaculum thermopropionicum SI]
MPNAVLMLVLMLGLLLGTSAVSISVADRITADRLKDQKQAYYVAEAGVERALASPWFLNTLEEDGSGAIDDDYPDSVAFLENGECLGGTVTVRAVRKPGSRFYIYSTGRYKGSVRVLKVDATAPLIFNNQAAPEQGGAFTLPQYRQQIENWFYQNADWLYEGGRIWDISEEPCRNGVYLFEGDVQIRGCYSQGAIIASTGKIIVDDELCKLGSEPLVLVSFEGMEICLSNAGLVEGLFCSAGSVEITGRSRVKGAVAGSAVHIGGEAVFEFDPSQFAARPPGLTGPVMINSWREKYSVF